MLEPNQPKDRLSDDQVAETLAALRSEASADQALSDLVEKQRAKKAERNANGQKRRPDDLLELSRTLWAARRITREELAHLVNLAADELNWERHLTGQYDVELDSVNVRMRAIEVAHGLKPDEFWSKADAPEEYSTLTGEWEEVLDRHMGTILSELGFDEFATIYNENRTHWNRMTEAGRRLFHTRSQLDPAETVSLLIDSYEQEASLCEDVGAFYAGCVMLGAAAEARLLKACLDDPKATAQARNAMPKDQRPRKVDPHAWTLEHMIDVAVEAGWVGVLEDTEFFFIVSGLVHRVRITRNYLHPGRHATDRPLSPLTEHEYRDAKMSYHALRLALEERRILPEHGENVFRRTPSLVTT